MAASQYQLPPWSVYLLNWRSIRYREGREAIQLETLYDSAGPNGVRFPDENTWIEAAPAWARDRRSEILKRMRSGAFEYKLDWRTDPQATLRPESLDQEDLDDEKAKALWRMAEAFEKSGKLEKALEYWEEAGRLMAAYATGSGDTAVLNDIQGRINALEKEQRRRKRTGKDFKKLKTEWNHD